MHVLLTKMAIDMKFDSFFNITTTCQRIVRCHTSIKRDKKWASQYVLLTFLSGFSFVFLAYSIPHDIETKKFFEACRHGTMVIVYITVSLKYLILVRYQESFVGLLDTLDNDYNTAKTLSVEDQQLVFEYARRGSNVSKFWVIGGYGTTFIFIFKAFGLMGYYYWQGHWEFVPMFDITYPRLIEESKNEPLAFWLLFFFCCFFATYASTIYVGFDPLVPIFMLHTCGQIDLLKARMSKVFRANNDPEFIMAELRSIIQKLQSLYAFVDVVKVNFAVLYEYILKATTFILPLTAYQLIEDLRAGRLNLEYTSFFVAGVIHFFLPSYYCDILMYASEEFRQCVYSSGWETNPSHNVRQIIVFMMTRANVTMGIKTVFYTINLATFAEMCRQSYALLNLMNAAWS